jgi:hypothetical protein
MPNNGLAILCVTSHRTDEDYEFRVIIFVTRQENTIPYRLKIMFLPVLVSNGQKNSTATWENGGEYESKR